MREQRRTAIPIDAARAVLSAFFGVRGQRANESARLHPIHLIAAGIVAAGLLVTGLILLVKFIVSQAV